MTKALAPTYPNVPGNKEKHTQFKTEIHIKNKQTNNILCHTGKPVRCSSKDVRASAFNVTMKNNYFGYHSTVMPVKPVTVPIPPGTTVGKRNWLRLIYRQRVVSHPGEGKKSGKNTRTHSRLGGRALLVWRVCASYVCS